METEEKFNQIYQKIVDEDSEKMEKARKEALGEFKHNMTILAIIIIINIVIDYSIYRIINDTSNLSGILFIISLFIYFKVTRKGKKEKYTVEFKTRIVRKLVESFDKQLEFLPRSGISSKIFNEGFMDSYDVYHSEDLIRGTIENDCKFEMSEVLTQEEHEDRDGNTSYSTVFSGLFAKIETPKPFNTSLYLRKDRKDKGIIGRMLSGNLPFEKLRIQLDSPEFEKIFDVYASDHIVAMQLLTADTMEDLIQFYNEMNMDYELTIKENCIYIRFWCGKMFETAGLTKFSLDRDTLYKYYKMLDFTFNLTNKMVKVLYETQYN